MPEGFEKREKSADENQKFSSCESRKYFRPSGPGSEEVGKRGVEEVINLEVNLSE